MQDHEWAKDKAEQRLGEVETELKEMYRSTAKTIEGLKESVSTLTHEQKS